MQTNWKSMAAGLALAALLAATPALAAELKIGVLVPTTGGQATYEALIEVRRAV